MSKKSSTNRQRSASHARTGASTKAQAARQASTATLVRAGGQSAAEQDTPRAANPKTDHPTPSPASIVRDTPTAPTKPVTPAKPSALKATAPLNPPARTLTPPAKPAPAATAPAAPARRQDTRLARARATQRARQGGLISSENYAYVIGDLKLIAGLAVGALAILIVLTFVLPR